MIKRMELALFLGEYESNPSPQKKGGWADRDDEYVRVSEFSEVAFEMLSHEETVLGQIAQIDKLMQKNRAESQEREVRYLRKRNDLLALTSE